MQKVLLTGATSFIGGYLKNKLKENYEIIAVSKNIADKPQETNVTWRETDLFDLEQTKQVMTGIDVVVHLAHSMWPNAKLTQAKVQDVDALLADNIAKATRANDVKHIIFVNGSIPSIVKLPMLFRNNLECERILSFYGTPVTTLQTNFIGGSNGVAKRLMQHLSPQQHDNIKDVCSITRVTTPNDYTMTQVATIYADFLNKVTFNMVESAIAGKHFEIKLLGVNKVLLSMEQVDQSSDPDRIVYQILGGALAKTDNNGNGTFEFRRLANSSQALVALQKFRPSLPWLFYKLTQAQLHQIVMNIFALKLNKQASRKLTLIKWGSAITLATIGCLLAKGTKSKN
jgi:hypothetical protein